MATRSDVRVSWDLSPRLIFVDDPSTEITIQDLHDTLRNLEQEVPNMIYPSLISSAGKEELGGGVSVGLTSTLENARIGFEARKVWHATGGVTTADATGRVLTDADGYFIADGILPGAWLVNTTDGSICTVLTVDSETQVTTDYLGGGTDNQFDSADLYRMMNVTQTEISGGNIVAVDENNISIDSIFPTAGVQVVRTSSSSATLQSQLQLEFSSFAGGVTVDTTSSYSGIDYPTGTPGTPVNNYTDALDISNARGISKFYLTGSSSITGFLNFKDKLFIGTSPSTTFVTVPPEAIVTNCEFQNMTLQGTLDGGSVIRSSLVLDLDYVNGFVFQTALGGTITLGGGSQGSLLSCYSNIPGNDTAKIDLGTDGNNLVMRDYHGGIELENCSGPSLVSIDMSSGHIIVADTVTDGYFTLRGISKITDNSTGSASVNTAHTIFPDELQLSSFGGSVHISTDNGISGTKFPRGTHSTPVNNWTDALAIATGRGIDKFTVDGYYAFSSTDDLRGYSFSGINATTTILYFEAGCNTARTVFNDAILEGTLFGSTIATDCELNGLAGIGCQFNITMFKNCLFCTGTITMGAEVPTPKPVYFVDCVGAPDGYGVTLDFGDSKNDTSFHSYRGDLTLENYTNGQDIIFGYNDGYLAFDSTCTSGTAYIDGVVEVADSSSPGFTVVNRSHLSPSEIADAVWNELVADHVDTATFGGWIGGKLLSVGKFLAFE